MTQELPEGTVTVLFTDVVGSTELTNRLGDDAAREILGACDELVRQQVERHRGREVKGTGDGLMVAFTSARRAVACAVDIQRAMAERARREPDRAVTVRIGLNTGEVIREEEDLFGATVTAAARIADHASAGEILVSDALKAVLGSATSVEMEDRGGVDLKGFPEPWRVHAVRWEEEASGPALMERTPYVGREEERSQLRRLLDQAARGEGALVMIGGEPGVGKTRLAEELAVEARERGFLALTGHCYEMEGAPPYIPFVEILEAAARTAPPEALREALGDAAPEVAKLMPELRRMFPDLPPPLELPPEQERRYLFNCMREFIERAGRAQPLLLVLEDLHWGDGSTLLLLQHIAQQLGEMPVLVVGTYRDVELDVARPLANALEDLLRQRLAHRIVLRRLPEGGVEAMLRALSGEDPPPALARVVYSETEGNPFFVEEVFKHLAEIGKLFDAQGRWISDLEVSDLDVPESVRLVLTRRLQHVSEETRRVLASAAVIGRVFSFQLLEALGEVDADVLLDAVDEADRAQLIASTSDGRAQAGARPGEARFSFAHELIRQTLVSGLSLPRRQRLHLRIGEAMETVYERDLEEHAADLAHHLYQAGTAADLEKTTRYLTMAGDQSLAAAAFEDALRLYESASSLEGTRDTRTRADLLYKRGSALRSLGRWEDAVACWEEALAAFEGLGDGQAVARISYEMSYQLAWANRPSETVAVARRGLDSLSEQVSTDRCRLLAMSAVGLSMGAEYAAADGTIVEALALAEQIGDDHLLGQVLTYKAAHHLYYMESSQQLQSGRRAVELLRAAGDMWELASALWYSQYALAYLGRVSEAAALGEEVEPLADRLGNAGVLWAARRGIAGGEFMLTGDIDRYEDFAKTDLEYLRRAEMPWISGSYHNIGLARFLGGDWQQALAYFRQAAGLEPPGMLAGNDSGGLFWCCAYASDRDAALAVLDEKRDLLPRAGQANSWGSWLMLTSVVEGLSVIGERDQAAELYPLVMEAVSNGTVSMWLRLVQTVAGIAAAAGEQWERAEEHYQTALRQAHDLPSVIEQPEVRRWYARMLIDRDASGDRDKGHDLLTEAIAMYRQIGMPKHVEMAEAMLGEV